MESLRARGAHAWAGGRTDGWLDGWLDDRQLMQYGAERNKPGANTHSHDPQILAHNSDGSDDAQ
eukprot:7365420-Alexandrium_andersonii.AAC.1